MRFTPRRTALTVSLFALSLLLAPAASPGDPAKDVKDKDVKVRLAAVEALEASGGKEAEGLLLEALKDKDWQVVERAAFALAKKGTAASLDALADLAADGPIRRIRVTAARSAAAIDATKAIEMLGRKLNGDSAVHALQAVGIVGSGGQNEAAAKVVEDALRPSRKHDKDLEKPSGAQRDRDPFRRAAAESLTAFPLKERVTRVEKLMTEPDLGVACAALDTVIAVPDPAFLPCLLAGFGAAKLDDCVERRIHNAIRAIVGASEPGTAALAAADPVLRAVAAAGTPAAATRVVRVLGDLAKAPPPPPEQTAADAAAGKEVKAAQPLLPPEPVLQVLGTAAGNADAKVRSAVAVALGKIRTKDAVGVLQELADKDKDAHVRLVAVRALAAAVTAKDQRAFRVFVDRLGDADPLVREEAAVALGVKGLTGAIPALSKLADEALSDRTAKEKKSAKWALGTAALVSMGKTEDPEAVEPLRKAAHDASDWRLRASAVIGLGRVKKSAAIEDVIAALDDKDPSVRNCAYEFLRRMTSKDVAADAKTWREWWKVNGPTYQFLDLEEEYRKARKYGYAPTIEGLYQGLDVVVLATRGGGDRIEDLLEVLKINHRECKQPKVNEAGLHPFALFFANCPGEIIAPDVEALAWYVRSGGYLFSSCWALKETVEKIYPGMVRRFLTPTAQVIDYTVTASPCVPDSPYLDGVFDQWTQPMYVLEGAHLIEVLDRDRVEVLIDSPGSATSWGSGNMACWFTAGHGVILDSVNHFNHQGFHFATQLKTAEDRMAYAMDHMGITYSDLRDFVAKKTFDAPQRCEKEVTDESAFRFISNFVRFKRKTDL